MERLYIWCNMMYCFKRVLCLMRIVLFVTCFVSTLYYIANGPLVNTLRAGNVVNIRKCVPAFIGYHVDSYLYAAIFQTDNHIW